MDENAENNDQNIGNDHDVQGEATENKRECLINVLQNVTLSFGNIKNIIEITKDNQDEEVNGFKKADRKLLKDWTWKVNAILKVSKSDNITGSNRFVKASWKKTKLKPNQRRGNAVKEHWWKRRIQQSIQELDKHINILVRKICEEIKKKEKYEVIEHKYRVKKKGLNVVLEELIQRM